MFSEDKATSIAVIDIGSNSTRFMLAYEKNGQIIIVEKRIVITRLGEHIASKKELSEDGINRTLDVIGKYMDIINDKKVEKFYAYATSAVRDATNKEEFINICRDRYQLNVEILDEKSEAEISYIGAAPSAGTACVVDIGGGSTEIAFGKDSKLEIVGSIPLGAVRASELYEQNEKGLKDLARAVGKQKIEYWEEKRGNLVAVSGTSRDLFRKVKKKNPAVYGVGGTITTLCALSNGLNIRYDSRIVNGRTMTRGEVALVAKEIELVTSKKNKVIPLLSGREDIILHGATILMSSMDALGVLSIIVSDNDGLEGYLKCRLLKDLEDEMRAAGKTFSAMNKPKEFTFKDYKENAFDRINESSHDSDELGENEIENDVVTNDQIDETQSKVDILSLGNDKASQRHQKALTDEHISGSSSANLEEIPEEEVANTVSSSDDYSGLDNTQFSIDERVSPDNLEFDLDSDYNIKTDNSAQTKKEYLDAFDETIDFDEEEMSCLDVLTETDTETDIDEINIIEFNIDEFNIDEGFSGFSELKNQDDSVFITEEEGVFDEAEILQEKETLVKEIQEEISSAYEKKPIFTELAENYYSNIVKSQREECNVISGKKHREPDLEIQNIVAKTTGVSSFEMPHGLWDIGKGQNQIIEPRVEIAEKELLAGNTQLADEESKVYETHDSAQSFERDMLIAEKKEGERALLEQGASLSALENLRVSISMAIDNARLLMSDDEEKKDRSFILYDDSDTKPKIENNSSGADSSFKKLNFDIEKIKRAYLYYSDENVKDEVADDGAEVDGVVNTNKQINVRSEDENKLEEKKASTVFENNEVLSDSHNSENKPSTGNLLKENQSDEIDFDALEKNMNFDDLVDHKKEFEKNFEKMSDSKNSAAQEDLKYLLFGNDDEEFSLDKFDKKVDENF